MNQETLNQLAIITREEEQLIQGAPLDMSVYNRNGIPIMDPGSLLPGGELFGIRKHTRFVDFPMHSHRYVEIIYQLQGKTVHIIDELLPLTLTAGQLLLLGRGTKHEIKAAGMDDLAINFILIPAFFDSAALQLGDSNALSVFLRGNLHNSGAETGHLVFDVSDSLLVQNILENLIVGQQQALPIELQRVTLELLLRHLSRLSGNLVAQTQQEKERALILSLLSRLEQDVRTSLSALAQEYSMDVSALSRLVKKYTRCTFTELLHTARFSRAATLLRETDLSIAEIATSVGYENTGFFYRRFETRYHCTPADYRKQHQSTVPV